MLVGSETNIRDFEYLIDHRCLNGLSFEAHSHSQALFSGEKCKFNASEKNRSEGLKRLKTKVI